MYKKRNYGRKAKKSIPRKTAKRKTSRKPSLVKTIKAVIHRQIENKTYTNYAANQSIPTCTGAAIPLTVSLLPTISQGVTVQNRTGNLVRVMRSQFSYRVNLLPYNAITNPSSPTYLKLFVVSLKNKSQYQGVPLVADFANFFQIGSSVANFSGNVLDSLFRINTDMFTIHTTRTHYLGTSSGSQAAGNNGNVGGINPFSAGTIYLDKYAKSLKYNDAVNDVTNRSLWLVCQAIGMDGSTGTGYIPAEIHYNHEVTFEDA